ncbi:MAG: hypothetical protein AB7Q45_15585 [Planctomycetaceae bacterium]
MVLGPISAVYWIGGPVVSAWRLRQITPGMSAAEVEQRLGPPEAGESDPQCWIYSRIGNPGWVEIHFDVQGRVLEVNDESPFPIP